MRSRYEIDHSTLSRDNLSTELMLDLRDILLDIRDLLRDEFSRIAPQSGLRSASL